MSGGQCNYTKVNIPGREDPVIFEVKYATLVDDNDEYESSIVPFDMMTHGIKVDMVPWERRSCIFEVGGKLWFLDCRVQACTTGTGRPR
jgi:hypothetical protein